MSIESVIRYEAADRIATVTLARPDVRNAMNGELGSRLAGAIADAHEADDVDVIILTGADPAFCSGADLQELAAGGISVAAAGDPRFVPDRQGRFAGLRGPFPDGPKLVIGAINGACVAGGLEVALHCDIRVASDRARFADTHARVDGMPGWGLAPLLVQAIGLSRSREMSATGRFVSADQALRWGLVNHVVPHESLLSFSRELASDAIRTKQPTLRRVLQIYDDIASEIYDPSWVIGETAQREWYGDADVPGRDRHAPGSKQ